jgi:Plasmid pRiA4b ORF-3-like protein
LIADNVSPALPLPAAYSAATALAGSASGGPLGSQSPSERESARARSHRSGGYPAQDDDWAERGDDWRHDIVVEKILPAEPGVAYPRCTAGRGETPAENSGGIWAFNEERAQDGAPGGGFDPADLTEALAGLAGVIAPASARRIRGLS